MPVPRLIRTRMSVPAHRQQLLDRGLAELGLELDATARARLLQYVDLLVRWNAHYNLTAVRDPDQMISRHLLDSLAILPWLGEGPMADIGSGAGLPGIPIAIVDPSRPVLLVDSNGKKARFLRTAARELGLTEVSVHEGRAETVETPVQWVTARAVAELPELLAWSRGLLAQGGRLLALKGKLPEAELAAVAGLAEVEGVHLLKVPGESGERHLVVLRPPAPH